MTAARFPNGWLLPTFMNMSSDEEGLVFEWFGEGDKQATLYVDGRGLEPLFCFTTTRGQRQREAEGTGAIYMLTEWLDATREKGGDT